jgi:hypothetical protein
MHQEYAAAVTGLPVGEVQPDSLPSEWFGNVERTRKPVDDTVGFANLLIGLSRRVDANLAPGDHEGS